MNRFKKYAAAATVIASLALPAIALAAVPLPQAPSGGGKPVTLSTIERLINQGVTFLVTISMVAAVAVLVYGGLSYMGVLGEARQKSAPDVLKKGIIGIAIVLATGLIIRTIANLLQSQSLTG